jgi:23S rRNA (cytosine1962-C5)-methyltransferase
MWTHGPYGGEGLNDWLKNREQRWADCCPANCVDDDKAGILIYAKSPHDLKALQKECKRVSAKKGGLSEFINPLTSQRLSLHRPLETSDSQTYKLRSAIINLQETNAYRLLHGRADGRAGWYIDRLGDFLLSQREDKLDKTQISHLQELGNLYQVHAIYHKILDKRLRESVSAESCPKIVCGSAAPSEFYIRENGLNYSLSFQEGYSVGIFLDQRDNRRRILSNHIAANFPPLMTQSNKGEVLNTFAYTCAFGLCAAKAGFRTTNLDLSKKYLAWGKRNYAINGIDSLAHDFIYGDVFEWLKRFGRKKRLFDLIILDPPSFSKSKSGGIFRAGKDYGRLISATLPILRPQGIILASTNLAKLEAPDFLKVVYDAVKAQGRRVINEHFATQSPDFPAKHGERAYLKTVWLKIA